MDSAAGSIIISNCEKIEKYYCNYKVVISCKKLLSPVKDNDPLNGCEHSIDESSCPFGSCENHAVVEGDFCAEAGWGSLLTCEGVCCSQTSVTVDAHDVYFSLFERHILMFCWQNSA